MGWEKPSKKPEYMFIPVNDVKENTVPNLHVLGVY